MEVNNPHEYLNQIPDTNKTPLIITWPHRPTLQRNLAPTTTPNLATPLLTESEGTTCTTSPQIDTPIINETPFNINNEEYGYADKLARDTEITDP